MNSVPRLQLSEWEIISSMYSEDELVLEDPLALDVLKSLVEREESSAKELIMIDLESIRTLRFTLKLMTDNKHSIEITFDLSACYPYSPPNVLVRSSNLNRAQNSIFNADLMNYITQQLPTEEPYLLNVTQWIKDSIEKYINDSSSDNSKKKIIPQSLNNNNSIQCPSVFLFFSRLWIFSHHIRSKIKRKFILDVARGLNLTGFCGPGKPGIICVEGLKRDAEEFWQKVRSLQWQKISLKHREDFEILNDSNSEINKFKKFKKFEEKSFFSESSCGSGNREHTDTKLLLNFLESIDCQNVFKIYFGVGEN